MGDDNLLDIILAHQLLDVVGRALNLHAVDAQAPLGWVVVGRDDGDTRHVRILRGHAVDGERAGFPRTDDERPRAIDVIPRERALLTALDAPQRR